MSVLIKGGRVITAADDYVGDIFVEDERISLIGESLDVAADTVDRRVRQVRAAGRGRPAHAPRHAVRRHDDDRRRRVGADGRPRSAARPATSTSASSRTGTSFGDALDDWKAKAEGKQLIDMGYHIAVTDLKEGGTLEELASLPDQGDHLVQALHGLQGRADGRRRDALQDDGGRGRDRRARDGARRERRRDRRAREEGARGGQDRAELPRAHAAARDRGRGDEPRDPARPRRRLRRSTSSTSPARSRSSRSRCAREKGWDVWGETCTQYFFVDYTFLERPDFEGAKYVYTPPPRDEGEPGRALGRGAHATCSARSRPTTARSAGTGRRRSARTTSRRSRTAGPGSRTGCT